MKRLLLLGLMICITNLSLYSQVRKVVLLEEATNASCSPCATYNPGLQSFIGSHFGGVISVRYHAWWPGSNDPMYTHNTVDNQARINYYGINSVPNYTMDGLLSGVPGDPNYMRYQMISNLKDLSPVKIDIQTNIDADSVRAVIQLIGLQTVSETGLYLRTAIIEREIVYATPPGSNGEKDFRDVMRKMMPNAEGISIASINPGDTVIYIVSQPILSPWIWDKLAVVSWLQSNTTKNIIQANISLPTYIIESSETVADFLQPAQSYTRHYWIKNDNADSLRLRLIPKPVQLASGWSYTLNYNSAVVDSFDVTIQPGDSALFELNINTGSTGTSKIDVFARNLNDPLNYGYTVHFVGVIKEGNILFVDDDGNYTNENYYYAAFDSINADYTAVSQTDLLVLNSQVTTSDFAMIFWNTGWGFPAFIVEDISFLTSYLDAGGRLFIAGQDIGWDVFDPDGSSNFSAAQNFYHNYLGANYLNDVSGGTSISGMPGDLVTDGISAPLATPYGSDQYPEQISSYSGSGSIETMKYNNNYIGAVRKDNGTYKTFYMGIGLEQVGNASMRKLLIQRVVDWFNNLLDVQGSDHQPTAFNLGQNYPNPFNPVTSIDYAIPQSSHVKLTIFNALGQKVRDLVNETLAPGNYKTIWDGKNQNGAVVSSGIYIYRLEVGNNVAQRKMLLIK